MPLRLLLVSLCGASFIGCDDPGGGGGGVTDVGGADADVSFSETTVDTVGGGSCTAGERRCSGQVSQQCVNGAWQDLFTCPSTQVCEAGACKSGETSGGDTNTGSETVTPDACGDRECGPDGQGGSCGSCQAGRSCSLAGFCMPDCVPDCDGKECGSDLCGGSCGTCDPRFQCVQGSCELTEVCDCAGAVCGLDNCGNSCGTCPGQGTCVGGQCISTEDGATCVDLIDCIYGETGCAALADETAFQACAEDCYAVASVTGANEFDAYLGCLSSCPEVDGDPSTTADDLASDRCAYQNCSDEEAYCVLETSGSGTCIGIIDCFDTCLDGDGDCYQACYEAATLAAQAALWGLDNCLTVECPDTTDDVCVDAAFQGQCVDFVVACQNN